MTIKITLPSCHITTESREDALWITQRLTQQEDDHYEVDEQALDKVRQYLKVHSPKVITVDRIRDAVPEANRLHGRTITAELKRTSEYEVGSKTHDGRLIFVIRALPQSSRS